MSNVSPHAHCSSPRDSGIYDRVRGHAHGLRRYADLVQRLRRVHRRPRLEHRPAVLHRAARHRQRPPPDRRRAPLDLHLPPADDDHRWEADRRREGGRPRRKLRRQH